MMALCTGLPTTDAQAVTCKALVAKSIFSLEARNQRQSELRTQLLKIEQTIDVELSQAWRPSSTTTPLSLFDEYLRIYAKLNDHPQGDRQALESLISRIIEDETRWSDFADELRNMPKKEKLRVLTAMFEFRMNTTGEAKSEDYWERINNFWGGLSVYRPNDFTNVKSDVEFAYHKKRPTRPTITIDTSPERTYIAYVRTSNRGALGLGSVTGAKVFFNEEAGVAALVFDLPSMNPSERKLLTEDSEIALSSLMQRSAGLMESAMLLGVVVHEKNSSFPGYSRINIFEHLNGKGAEEGFFRVNLR
jgi:hypothetical protein